MLPIEVIRALPKTDLHVHLDGSLRLETLIELARERQVKLPSDTPEGLNELLFRPTYANLVEYLEGFNYTCAVMHDAEALERIAYEFAWDNINEGVRYVEVRFAPQLHVTKDLTLRQVLLSINKGLARAEAEYAKSDDVVKLGQPPFHYGLIVCAMRFFVKQSSEWFSQLIDTFPEAQPKEIYSLASLELARAVVRIRDEEGIPIVGFDLAGAEAGYPASDHQAAYDCIHKAFMHSTVHAGEAYGPESIFQAITDLHADRIGHGYHLFSPELCSSNVANPQEYVDRLCRYIADRRLTIEVCITSNLQTNPTIGEPINHAFGKMLKENLSATLCTDNRLVSHTDVSREVQIALETFKLTPRQLRDTIVYGFKRCFFSAPYRERRLYVRQILDYYDRIMSDWEARSLSH